MPADRTLMAGGNAASGDVGNASGLREMHNEIGLVLPA
jgi:hypothetical protein